MKKTILITAGPTREAIDPVRYLSNHSSGKMGYALAQAAISSGHRVILISGPTNLKEPQGAHLIPVVSALDMKRAVLKHLKKADVVFMVAAVADYRPERIARQKIKKSARALTLKLIPNPDILKELGTKKRADQIVVGFAAETNNTVAYAKKKLASKKCDWIILNNVAKAGIGFGSEQNEVTLFSKTGHTQKFPRQNKTSLALRILSTVIK